MIYSIKYKEAANFLRKIDKARFQKYIKHLLTYELSLIWFYLSKDSYFQK